MLFWNINIQYHAFIYFLKIDYYLPSVKFSCSVAIIELILQQTNSVTSSSVSKECKVGETLSKSHCQSCWISCSVKAVAITIKKYEHLLSCQLLRIILILKTLPLYLFYYILLNKNYNLTIVNFRIWRLM